MPNDPARTPEGFKPLGLSAGPTTVGDLAVTRAMDNSVQRVDAAAGVAVAQLPDLGLVPNGYAVYIQKRDATANTVTVTPFAGQTVNGGASAVLAADGDAALLVAMSATDWAAM